MFYIWRRSHPLTVSKLEVVNWSASHVIDYILEAGDASSNLARRKFFLLLGVFWVGLRGVSFLGGTFLGDAVESV